MTIKNYRYNDIQKNCEIIGYYPLDVMVTGVTGAGKSTTLNSFLGKDEAVVGQGVDPQTMNIASYLPNEYFRIWDTPGLGDSPSKDEIHKNKIIDLLHKTYIDEDTGDKYYSIDMVIVIIEGSNRDLGTTYKLLNDVIVKNIKPKRVLVVINQADFVMSGHHWDDEKNEPDEVLLKQLDDKAKSVKNRIFEATGLEIPLPIYYSAKYGYNITKLFDFIIDNMPKKPRKHKNKK